MKFSYTSRGLLLTAMLLTWLVDINGSRYLIFYLRYLIFSFGFPGVCNIPHTLFKLKTPCP